MYIKPNKDEPIVIEIRGRVPASKNRYTPRKGGKGFFKNTALQTELDRIALQIPGWARSLKLESPEIHIHFRYTTANWDRTNAYQSLEDLLVKYGVLANDNLKRANGLVSIHPAEKSDSDGVTVVLIPQVAAPEFHRYVRPTKRRNLAPIFNMPLEPEPPDGEDLEIDWDTLWDI